MKNRKIIFIDNDADSYIEMLKFLKNNGFDITRVFKYAPLARDYIQNGGEYDIAIIDRCLSSEGCSFAITGEDLMELSKKTNPSAVLVSFSGYYDKLPIIDKHLTKPAFDEDLEELVSYLRERTI